MTQSRLGMAKYYPFLIIVLAAIADVVLIINVVHKW